MSGTLADEPMQIDDSPLASEAPAPTGNVLITAMTKK